MNLKLLLVSFSKDLPPSARFSAFLFILCSNTEHFSPSKGQNSYLSKHNYGRCIISCDTVWFGSSLILIHAVEEVGKDEGKGRCRAWGQYLFCGTVCKWLIPVPNTSAGRTLAYSCVVYREVINVFEQTVVAELPYNVNQQNCACIKLIF